MPEGRAPGRWWVWAAGGVILAALVGAIILWWQPIYGLASDQERVREWVAGLGPWGPIAIVLLTMLQAILAPVPGQAIQAVSGYLYGPWLGMLYSLSGMAIGSLITFALARRFGRPLAVRLVGEEAMERLDGLVRRGGAPFFFLLWLFPFTPDDLACVAAGLTPMAVGQFLALMIVARTPGIWISVLVGANAAQIDPLWWFVLFGAIAIAGLIVWRWREQIQKAVLSLVEGLSKWFRA